METPCDNPWRQLPNKFPFVLSQEAQLIEQFNSTAIDRFKVHLEILPEPYLGNPDAPVVLLGLNPGFKESDIEQHRDARFAALSRANLLHEPAEYPFYLLDSHHRQNQMVGAQATLLDRTIRVFEGCPRSVLCGVFSVPFTEISAGESVCTIATI